MDSSYRRQDPGYRARRPAGAALLSSVIMALALGCASVPSNERTPESPASPPASTGDPPAFARRAWERPITAACRATVRPDRAVIVGGISASGIKPSETAERLQRQLDVLETVASQHEATLRRVERVRAARLSSVRSARVSSARTRDDEADPYVVIQRIELEVAADADVDLLLDRALQVGLDRYGISAGIGGRSAAAQPLVVYRFSDFDEMVGGLHTRCRETAIRAWCEAQADTDAAACSAALHAREAVLVTEQLLLTSQQVARADGSFGPVQLSWPFEAAAPIELGGDTELRFSGAITLRLPSSFE